MEVWATFGMITAWFIFVCVIFNIPYIFYWFRFYLTSIDCPKCGIKMVRDAVFHSGSRFSVSPTWPYINYDETSETIFEHGHFFKCQKCGHKEDGVLKTTTRFNRLKRKK